MVKTVKSKLPKPRNLRQSNYDFVEPPFPPLKPTRRPKTKSEIIRDRPNPGYVSNPEEYSAPIIAAPLRLPSILRFDIDRFDNECNKSVVANVKLLGWRIPTIRIGQRNLTCRLEAPELEEYEYECQPSPECEGDGRSLYIWLEVNTSYYEDGLLLNNNNALFWVYTAADARIDKVEFPDDFYHNPDPNVFDSPLLVYAVVTITVSFVARANYNIDDYTRGREKEYYNFKRDEDVTYSVYVYARDSRKGLFYGVGSYSARGTAFKNYESFVYYARTSSREIFRYSTYGFPYQYRAVVPPGEQGITGSTVTPFRAGNVYPVDSYYDGLGFKVVQFDSNIRDAVRIEQSNWVALSVCEFGGITAVGCTPKLKFPPPPPKPPMRCCPDNSQLLKQILKIVKQNNKAIGYDDYPVTVPKSLINTNNKEPGTEDKESLTQLIAWYIERFDEIVGQFEIPIKIEDADLIQEGNQELEIKLPNIAEAIAEMFLMLLNLNITNEVQMNMVTRILAETGADKQQNFKSYEILEAIVEFLGFKYKDEVKKLPLTFTPGKENLSEILKEKEVDVSCIEFDDNTNLPKQMHELLQAAAIIRAKHWKPMDAKKDIKQQLLGTILQNKNLIDEFVGSIDLADLESYLNKVNKE